MESRNGVLVGMRSLHFPLVLMNRLNTTETAVLLYIL